MVVVEELTTRAIGEEKETPQLFVPVVQISSAAVDVVVIVGIVVDTTVISVAAVASRTGIVNWPVTMMIARFCFVLAVGCCCLLVVVVAVAVVVASFTTRDMRSVLDIWVTFVAR